MLSRDDTNIISVFILRLHCISLHSSQAILIIVWGSECSWGKMECNTRQQPADEHLMELLSGLCMSVQLMTEKYTAVMQCQECGS